MPPHATPPAAVIAVWVQPGASRERVAGMMGEAVKIAVAAPPEKGKANQAVERFLAAEFGLPPRAVAVVAGAASKQKRVRLEGVTAEQARSWVNRFKTKG